MQGVCYTGPSQRGVSFKAFTKQLVKKFQLFLRIISRENYIDRKLGKIINKFLFVETFNVSNVFVTRLESCYTDIYAGERRIMIAHNTSRNDISVSNTRWIVGNDMVNECSSYPSYSCWLCNYLLKPKNIKNPFVISKSDL